MRKKGYPPEESTQQASGSQRLPYLKDVARRLFDTYIDTFKQAPESDFLFKRYFFTIFFQKNHLQDNEFFIPRADFLWYFKYFLIEDPGVGIAGRTIELKKRSTEIAETQIEIAKIHIRKYYTYEQGAADIIYIRKASESTNEAFILKNTKEAVKQVAQLLVDFHNDKVMSHPY
jgi:hypothetical protein